jgi:hypothetical protein
MTAESLAAQKAWRERANTIGYIAGGMEHQVSMLREVLTQLPSPSKSTLSWKKPDGKQASVKCDELCGRQLSTAGLVERTADGDWIPSKAAAEWLNNNDAIFLAKHLHAHVKFFGEFLAAIGPNTTQSDILDIAKSSYGLNWRSTDQVSRRSGWLRGLGMIELWGHKVVRTPEGESLLSSLALCSPDDATRDQSAGSSDTIEDQGLLSYVSSLSDTDQESLRGRRPLIGYIPRGSNSANRDAEDTALTPMAAIRKLVEIVGEGVTIDEFADLCVQEFGINKSSFSSTLHSLRHTDLIEQTSYNFFASTDRAKWLVATGNEKALIAHLHSRFSFFGEILDNLQTPSSTSQLSKVAKEEYGYSQASNGEIRLRLSFLQDAGLVDRVDWQRFRVTSVGRKFATLLTLQQKDSISGQDRKEESTKTVYDTGKLLAEIVESLMRLSRDGNESKAFEVTVSHAFRLLGFHTEHLGGSGQTDVLALAELAPGDRYRVIVDAKSSGNGIIAESAINFEVLRDHKKKHKADHVVVVGPDFANRLKDWAVKNDVVLLPADDLAAILERHAVNPISIIDLRDALARVDSCKDEILDRYQLLERRSLLVQKILELAYEEAGAEDQIESGSFSPEGLIFALRKEFSPRPSMDEIRQSLIFLANPLVGAVEENKGRYRLADSPHNVSLRLHGLGVSLALE